MIRPRPLAVLTLALVAITLALAAAWAAPARAQVTAAPPLTGTVLFAFEGRFGVPIGTIEITADCAQQQISWEATGVATGTYSGPYTETGTATLTAGEFTFTAQFTIDSPIGLVSGTKGVSVPGGSADCVDFGGGDQFSILLHPNAPYTATITTATGTCTTEGTSTIGIEEASGAYEQFVEDFNTGTVPVCSSPCPPDDDDDGDGLSNSRESILSTLVGIADSDGDGIRDGNDDANRNGEDDEDEDDDDECPDEDSDGDGEDDEDEDDEEDDDDD